MVNVSSRRAKRRRPSIAALVPAPTPTIVSAVETVPRPPAVSPDRAGLYAVLGLTPRATAAEVASAYRHLAVKLSTGRQADSRQLRRVNLAYGILGNSARRAEYDQRLGVASSSALNTTWGSPERWADPRAGYPSPYHPRKGLPIPGLAELLAVLAVILVTVAVGLVVLDRVQVDLSPALAAANAVGLGGGQKRPAAEVATAAAASSAASATSVAPAAQPTLADQLKESTVAVSDPRPARNSAVTVDVKLVRNGQPVSGADVYLTAQYRTVKERIPPTGAVQTDRAGTASIPINVGEATPGYEVAVEVFAQADGRQTSWQTSFTPR